MYYLLTFQPSHLNSTPLIILSCIQFSKEIIVKGKSPTRDFFHPLLFGSIAMSPACPIKVEDLIECGGINPGGSKT